MGATTVEVAVASARSTRMFAGSPSSVSLRRQCGPDATQMATAPPASLQIVDTIMSAMTFLVPASTPAARLRARDAVGTLRLGASATPRLASRLLRR